MDWHPQRCSAKMPVHVAPPKHETATCPPLDFSSYTKEGTRKVSSFPSSANILGLVSIRRLRNRILGETSEVCRKLQKPGESAKEVALTAQHEATCSPALPGARSEASTRLRQQLLWKHARQVLFFSTTVPKTVPLPPEINLSQKEATPASNQTTLVVCRLSCYGPASVPHRRSKTVVAYYN